MRICKVMEEKFDILGYTFGRMYPAKTRPATPRRRHHRGRQPCGGFLPRSLLRRSAVPVLYTRALLIAASTRCGVSGVSLISTSNGASASRTALAMAAGGATAPPSPIPFMPYSVAIAGVCRCPIRIPGSSCAPGTW